MLSFSLRVFHDFSKVGTVSYEDIVGDSYLDILEKYDKYVSDNKGSKLLGLGVFYTEQRQTQVDHRYFKIFFNRLFSDELLSFLKCRDMLERETKTQGILENELKRNKESFEIGKHTSRHGR